MKKKIIIAFIIIAVLVVGFLAINNKNSTRKVDTNATLVKLMDATPETLVTKVSADGTAKAREEKDIKAGLNGLVRDVFVETGDEVDRGDEIFAYEDQDLLNDLEAVRISLVEARSNYEELQDTYERQQRVNELKLKEAERNLEMAELSLQTEENSLENQRSSLEEQLLQTQTTLDRAEETFQNNQLLYEKGAIPYKTLKEAEDAYKQAGRSYERLKKELEVLTEETIPNSLYLARLKVENARSQLELLKSSIEAEKVTEKDLEIAKLNIDKLTNQLEQLQADKEKLNVRAPLAGTIISLEVKPGDKVMEGATVGQIADLKQFIIEAMVDEIDVNEVNKGQKVKITSDAFDATLEGEVTYVAPAGTRVGNITKYETRILVKGDGTLLKPGMFVNSEIITNEKEGVIAVPSLAILGDEEKYVFVMKDGKAEKRPVEIGLKSLSKVEISGVEEGEKIIVGPFTVLQNLKPGQPVAGEPEAETTGETK